MKNKRSTLEEILDGIDADDIEETLDNVPDNLDGYRIHIPTQNRVDDC